MVPPSQLVQQQLLQLQLKTNQRRKIIVQLTSFILVVTFGLSHLENNSINVKRSIIKSNGHDDSKWKHIRPITNADDKNVKISFQIHTSSNHPLTHKFNLYMKCPLGDLSTGKGNRRQRTGEVRTGVVPEELMKNRKGKILNFTTTISTTLHLLHIGDSVTIQFSYTLEEIFGGAHLSSRSLLWDSWPGHVGGSVVFPTYGGGALGTWRLTGLLSKGAEGKPGPNLHGGGWNREQVDRFLNHTSYGLEVEEMKKTEEAGINQTQNSTVLNHVDFLESNGREKGRKSPLTKFHVVIFRTQHGWMKLKDITPSRFLEAMHLASELFGAETVILQTIPFTNNIKTKDDLIAVNRINKAMRNIAKNYHPEDSTLSLKHVLVQEYGQYVNHLIWMNARHLGYNVSDPTNVNDVVFNTEGPTFLFDRLNEGREFSPTISMVCSNMESLGEKRDKCDRNYLFSDGMHVCPERLAVRYADSLACLVGCVYNGDKDGGGGVGDVRGCERECNDLFMSVSPVKDEWVDGNVTLAAFA